MKNKLPIALIVASMLVMCIAVRNAIVSGSPPLSTVIGADYRQYFQPATSEILRGHSPYTVNGFYNPAWGLLPLLPLTKLPLSLSIPIMFVLNLSAYTYVAWRTGMNRFIIIPFLIFSGAMLNSTIGNIDGLLSLGFLFSSWLGILIVMVKPQIGIPIAIFFVATILLDHGALKTKALKLARLLTPFVFAMIFSTMLYGTWFFQSTGAVGQQWNSAPWPRAIPVGVFLLWQAVQKKDIRWAMGAIPFITPYLTPDTWALSTMGFLAILSTRSR